MALGPQFLEELKARFTLSDVIGRRVKLRRAGREFSGLCPFHNEKTPSFTVNDQKGFYHCFGCGAHGSVIDFVMDTEGLEFLEAVDRLATEAGMEMPRQTREETERQKERLTLSEVMGVAAEWYRRQLHGAGGRAALDYVRGRGLSDDTVTRFGLGYAPDSRTALKTAMAERGIAEKDLIATGMLIAPEDGGEPFEPYDRFRGRLMFPITDRQGRVIAFGGRALSADVKAKYLNSPETTLFHKGRTLYNWAEARKAAYDVGHVIVGEGYMDVIALSEAGLHAAVAPLGTALTEEQIAHLWAMADEPVLAFDGDKAGRRAANRAVERALPLLKPGKSLRFLFLPEGDDPDSLVRREGRGAFEALMDRAAPLADMLWHGLSDGVPADTPERRAGLEKAVFTRLAEIDDETIRKLYQQDFRRRLNETFGRDGAGRRPRGGPARRSGRGAHAAKGRMKGGINPGYAWQQDGGIKGTALGRTAGDSPVLERLERLMILTLVHHPQILVRHEEAVAETQFTVPGLDRLRDLLLECLMDGLKGDPADAPAGNGAGPLDRERVATHLITQGAGDWLTKLKADPVLRNEWFAWEDAALSDAITGFEHVMARYAHVTQAWGAYKAAEADYRADMSEEAQTRFFAAQEAFRAAEETAVDKPGYGLESNRLRS